VGCTIDTCNPQTGACTHQPYDPYCDDGLVCTGIEKCSPTGCVAGTPINCDDGVACTLDQCQEPSGACVHIELDYNCDDGNVCSGADICPPTGGRPGGRLVCPPENDGIACPTGKCDPVLNACKPYPDDSLCPCGQYCSTTLGCTAQCNVSNCQ